MKINVNLKANGAANPVLIPCQLPRTVEFKVALGECRCREEEEPDEVGGRKTTEPGHFSNCPARPISVTCTIDGDTWEESFVDGADFQPMEGARRLIDACDDRWALVKALVLGKMPRLTGTEATDLPVIALIEQRDAVFAALCDMARAENGARTAHHAMVKALDVAGAAYSGAAPVYNDVAARGLAAYVAHLLEQVGAL